MAISHIQERLLAISRIPQTAFQTALPAVTSNPLAYVELLVKDQNLTKFDPKVLDNDGFSTRSDFPTETYLSAWDASVDHTLQLETDMIGRLLYAALGSIVTTQPDSGGNPLVYSHALKPMAPFTGRQLPYYTYVEKIGSSSLDQKFLAMCVERLTIRGQGVDRVEVEVTFRGSGKRTSPSAINFSGGSNHVRAATGLRYLFHTQASLAVRDYSTLANSINYSTSCRFRTFEITFENNLLADDGYCPGSAVYQTANDPTSGLVRNELLFGKRNYSMNFVIRVDSATDEMAKIQAQSPLDILIDITGAQISGIYNDKLSINAKFAKYQAVEIGNENGIVTFQITPRILYDVTSDDVINLTLVNKTSSYTT